MAKYPSLPLWVDAYLLDTNDLTADEHGIYLTMLMLAWRRQDCALPDDMPWLKRALAACFADGMHGHTFNAKAIKVLHRFFHLEADGKWHQKRLDKERGYLEARSARQRQNALKRNQYVERSATTHFSTEFEASNSAQTEFKSISNEPDNMACLVSDQQVNVIHGFAPIPIHTPNKKVREESSLRSPKKPTASRPTAVDADKRSSRGHRIPDAWVPCEVDRDFARRSGLSEAEIDTAAAEFVDYWRAKPGQGGTKLDWSATWRNRIRELVARNQRFGSTRTVNLAAQRKRTKMDDVRDLLDSGWIDGHDQIKTARMSH